MLYDTLEWGEHFGGFWRILADFRGNALEKTRPDEKYQVITRCFAVETGTIQDALVFTWLKAVFTC